MNRRVSVISISSGLAVVLALLLGLFRGASASGSGSPRNPKSVPLNEHQSTTNPYYAPSFPTLYGVQQTGQVNAAFDAFGCFGLGYLKAVPDLAEWPKVSFEAPPGSNVDYLFGGSIWIGGIVNGDTLVSVGDDGWQYSREFYPPQYSSTSHVGSVEEIDPIGDHALRSECDDSLHTGIEYLNDVIAHRSHTPLDVKMAIRSHTWRATPQNNCIVYDVVLNNFGKETVDQGFIGLLMDPDIGDLRTSYRGQDDVMGSLRDSGFAYATDNDGNFSDAVRSIGGFGCKVLWTSWSATDTSFNWWASTTNVNQDFGPRLRANYRNFMTGGSGTPEGDANKYYLMSHPEWDYDQVRTGTTGMSDTMWLPPNAVLAQTMSKGFDTKFLLSIGHFELPPDSSVRLIFSTFYADSIHTNPLNGRCLTDPASYDPDRYQQGLNFTNLYKNGHIADSLSRLLVDPMNPVEGLHIASRSHDTVVIEWDDWCLGNIDGYNIYLSAIPDSAFPYPGVLPPWYRGPIESPTVQIERQHRYRFTGVDPNLPYTCTVAHRAGTAVGKLGRPLVFRFAVDPPSPVTLDTVIYFRQMDGAVIRWQHVANPAIDHFNIYKFDSAAVQSRYLPFYVTSPRAFPFTTLFNEDGRDYFFYEHPVYATVGAQDSTFVDSSAGDNDFYAITAVNVTGYSSPFSGSVKALEKTRNADVLVMYNSNPATNYVVIDSIKRFYSRILQGRTFDMFSWYDSTTPPRSPNYSPTVVDWHRFLHYRLLIIDDGLNDGIMIPRFEDSTHGFTNYLLSGGRIAYFGGFSNFGTPLLDASATPKFYSRDASFIQRFFGIDSVFNVGFTYYADSTTAPYIDTVFGFHSAEAVAAPPADVTYDASHYRYKSTITAYWPAVTPPSISTFKPNARGQTIYRYRSLYPTKSRNEGQPVGIVTSSPEATTYLFGFHLWHLDSASAHGLVDWLINQTPPAPSPATGPSLPSSPVLSQNYPNPFNPSTTIAFTLPRNEHVTLDIYNILGQRVVSLIDANLTAGEHRVLWNGTDAGSHPVSCGIYLYRLTAGATVACRKMVLLK